jgi:hypothetical protein
MPVKAPPCTTRAIRVRIMLESSTMSIRILFSR